MSKTKTTLAKKCVKLKATIKTYSGIKADTEKRENWQIIKMPMKL